MKALAVIFLLTIATGIAQAQLRPLDTWIAAQKTVTSAWDTTIVTSRSGGWPVFIRIHADSIAAGDTVYVAKDTDTGASHLIRVRNGDTPIVIGPTILSQLLLKASTGDTLKVRIAIY